MNRTALIIGGLAALALLGGCAADDAYYSGGGGAYYNGAYYNAPYYDGAYYDGYYGPDFYPGIYGGYAFIPGGGYGGGGRRFRDGGHDGFRRGDGHWSNGVAAAVAGTVAMEPRAQAPPTMARRIGPAGPARRQRCLATGARRRWRRFPWR